MSAHLCPSLNLIFGDPNKKLLGELRADVDKINGLETSIQTLTDEALKEKTAEFRQRFAAGESLDVCCLKRLPLFVKQRAVF